MREELRSMTTGYADDILPLFRQIDINCMTPKGVHLGDAQRMCNAVAGSGFDDHGNARRVFAALSAGFMPSGNRWPQDWLDTYSDWMTDGFQP
jgi:hypothetical protein